MGIASRDNLNNISIDRGDGVKNLLSRTIICPADGFVMATASVYFIQFGSAHLSCLLGISRSPSTIPPEAEYGASVPRPLATVSFHEVFEVTAGANIFHLNAQNLDDQNLVVTRRRLTLIFVRTAYGTVDAN